MTRVLYIIPLVALLLSCSPNFYCKKCTDRGGIKSDTLKQIVEVPVPSVRIDTVLLTPGFVIDFDSLFNAQPDMIPRDTIYLKKERIKIKLVPGPKTFIQAECLPDTLRIEVPVLVSNEIKTGHSTTKLVVIVSVIGLILLFVGVIIGKLFTK